jgi:hypothetical protein
MGQRDRMPELFVIYSLLYGIMPNPKAQAIRYFLPFLMGELCQLSRHKRMSSTQSSTDCQRLPINITALLTG